MFLSAIACILTLGMVVIAAAVFIRVQKGVKESVEPTEVPVASPGPASGTRSKNKKQS